MHCTLLPTQEREVARPDDSPPAVIDWLLFAVGVVILLASGMPLWGMIINGFLLTGVLSGNWFAQAGLLFFVSLHTFSPGTAWRIFFYVFILRAIVYYFAFSDRNRQPDLESVEAHQTQALQREETERLAKIDEIGRFTQSVIHIYAQTTMSSRQRQQQLQALHQERRARLQATGELTPAVDAVLRDSRDAALRNIAATTAEIGQLLTESVRSYAQTGKRNIGRSIRLRIEKHGFLWE